MAQEERYVENRNLVGFDKEIHYLTLQNDLFP
jgi:hypothetical protein